MKQTIKRNISKDEVFLDEAFEEFIECKEAINLSKSTIDNYKLSYRVFKNDLGLDDKTLCSDIEERLIYKWIQHMRNEELSIQSINHYLRDIRAILYFIFDKNYSVDGFRIKLLKVQEEMPKAFTDDEILLLLEHPRRSDGFVEWRTWAIVSFIMGTGARAKTVCSLKVSDINFTRKEITYPHTKNNQVLVIPLSDSLETCLKEYIKMWRDVPSGYLFPNIGDEPLTTNALHLSFKRYCQKKGIEKSNIHGLRHSFAAGWIKTNGNAFALKNILGHQSMSMTNKYVRLYGQDLKPSYSDHAPLDQLKKKRSRRQKVDKQV